MTGRSVLKTLLLISLGFCFCRLLLAADVEIRASVNAEEITLDDLLIYTVSFKGITRPDNLDLSDLRGFKIIQQYRGSSFQIINGESSYYINLNYYLKPLRTGTLMIPPVDYEYKGKTYQTRAIEIRVTEGAGDSSGGRSPRRRPKNPLMDRDIFQDKGFFSPRPPEEIDVQLETELSSRTVMVGEQLLLRVLLRTQNRVASVNLLSNPTFEGFWNEEFPNPSVISGTGRVIDGKSYRIFVIKKVALFPSRSGTVTIPPLEFEIKVVSGGGTLFSEEQRLVRRTGPLSIQVRPLPLTDENVPVGQFEMQVKKPPSEVDISEICTIRISISGNGNIKTAALPEIKGHKGFKVYPAKMSSREDFGEEQVISRVDIEYPLTFLSPGPVSLGTVNFRYFDSRTNRVEQLSENLGTVTVTGSPKPKQRVSTEDTEESPQTGIARAGEDISFIRKGDIFNQAGGMYRRGIFLVIMALPFILNLLFLIKRKLYDPLISRSKAVEGRKILNETLQNLQSVRSYQGISPVLEQYFHRKLGLGFASLSNLEIDRRLVERGVREFDINHLIKIKSRSDSARFSGSVGGERKLKNDLDLLYNIIRRIDRHLK